MSLKNLFVSISMICFVVSCEKNQRIPKAIAVSEDGSMEVHAMTLNLRYENPQEIGKRHWAQRIVGIVQMIRKEKPDFFGIQEGLHGQVADLRASLYDFDFHGVARSDGKRNGEYCGIFFLKDRFVLDADQSGKIWLSDTPEIPGSHSWGNEFPRVATWVRLIDRSNEKALWVINLHLDHKNQVSREKSVRLMVERLIRLNPNKEPVIFMGDFNAVESNPALLFLKGNRSSIAPMKGFEGFIDTYQALHPTEKKRGTLHFWMSDPNRQWKVDHIFASKGAKILEAKVLRGKEPYLSDHFPVTARIKFLADGEK